MDVLAFDAKKVDRPVLLTIAAYLLVIAISLMTTVKPAHADGQVDSINVYTINSGGFNNGCFGKASIAEAMQCDVDFENSFLDADYAQIASWGGYDIAICPRAVAHDLNTSNPNLYFFKVSPLYRLFAYMPPNPKIAVCTGGGETSSSINVIPSSCPSNTNAGFPCTCKDGYKPDPTHTSCVPAVDCPIPGLNPLTDPVATDFDNNVGSRWRPDLLTHDYQAKLKCVEDEITARGGSSVGTSAYRPFQYQRHLFEIVDKDFKLSRLGYMSAHPECQALRDTITHEMGPPPGHGLRHNQRVAMPGKSHHESGEAFDLTPSGLTDAQLAPIYSDCGVTHTAVPGEPWHVE